MNDNRNLSRAVIEIYSRLLNPIGIKYKYGLVVLDVFGMFIDLICMYRETQKDRLSNTSSKTLHAVMTRKVFYF